MEENSSKRKFICSKCGKSLSSAYNLRIHVDSNCSTEKNFNCKECNRSFLTLHSLKTHINTIHEKDKKFICSFCSKDFASKGQLKVHERSHTKEKIFHCPDCPKSFSHRESLVTHSTTHSKIKPYACENCQQTFSCVGNLIKHRKVRPNSCGLPIFTNKKICNRVGVKTKTTTKNEQEIAISNIVEEPAIFEREFIEVHQDVPQTVTFITVDNSQVIDQEFIVTNEAQELQVLDDYSQKEVNVLDIIGIDVKNDEKVIEFIDEEAYMEVDHQTNNEEEEEINEEQELAQYLDIDSDSRYCCKFCPKIYSKKNISIKHLQKEHQIVIKNWTGDFNNRYRKTQRDQSHNCKFCPRKFTSAKLADKHESLHGSDGKLVAKCSCCNLYFKTRDEVTEHQNKVHLDRLQCKIENCGRTFDHPEKLLSHKKYSHAQSGSKNAVIKKYTFVCTLCGRNFNTKVALSDHERSDCGKNPIYTCSHCSKKYHSAGSLKCHMKIHTRELNFFCDYCSKKFRTKGQLIIHERSHTKFKPFKCQFPNCNASFSHRESILTHNTIHTGIKRYECNKCNLQFSCISNLLAHKRSRKEKSCGSFDDDDRGKIQKVQNARTTLRSVTAT